ncbi:MAG: hypothetical protein HC934_01140 [Acaryochloridaceae cyanobacterium SU_2_1]|nr:hypothetical protein [Acaryochloridaceae cyanobacterium SU_2_1]
MIFSVDASIPFPRPLVYQTYRDRLLELLPYMGNVQRIEPRSAHQEQGKLRCSNDWYGGGEIPAIARAFISEQMLSWTEHNIWDDQEYSVLWRIETHAFTEAVTCAGKNYFHAQGNTTMVENRGELVIHAQKLEGVPDFLKPQVAEFVEALLGQKIGPNLRQMSEGVRQYLNQQELSG